MSKFNLEQQDAIDQSVETNVLISAGAGSGKTATLSEKVRKIIEDKNIKPSELLVLTFTNNAAHHMKEKIQSKFKGNTDFTDEMLSSHIQTFDSFLQYLVRIYARKLNITDKFALINDNILNIRKEKIIDEIFEEYLNSSDKNDSFSTVMSHYSCLNEESLKQIVKKIITIMDKLTIKEREDILINYDSKYLNETFYKTCHSELCKLLKDELENSLRIADFLCKHFDQKKTKEDKDDDGYDDRMLKMAITDYFTDKTNFNTDINTIEFNYLNQDHKDLPRLLKELYKTDDNEFFEKWNEIKKDYNSETLNGKYKGNDSFKVIRNFLTDPLLNNIPKSYEEGYRQFSSQKDDIHFFLNVIKEVYLRLDEFKRVNQTYSFADISDMASQLLRDKEVIKNLKETYKFIMIDEYQDTNDSQENFINALLKQYDDDSGAHIFCVGDAKQSIYGFRNSKVELFRQRQQEYLNDSKHGHVIAMNKNYRSGKKLLEDINHIFNSYMTLDHGGIDYKSKLEQLEYDDKTDIYNEKYDDFGIERIISQCSEDDNTSPVDYEIMAIISDIKKKMKEGYLVYDKDANKDKIRPCKLSDFCIITRTKAAHNKYLKYFNTYDIPLNVRISNDLNEEPSIIVIKTLFNIIQLLTFKKNLNSDELKQYYIDLKHLLCSLARSYIYAKDDNYVQALIDSKSIEENEIYKDIKDFINRNYNTSPILIFDNMINDFNIVRKLSSLYNVVDNVNRIESLRNIFLSECNIGHGIDEFATFIEDLKHYKSSISDDSTIAIDDAVDLMTIHASKGLEKKIVYMPLSYNKYSKGNQKESNYADFSLKYGLLLLDCNIEEDEEFNRLVNYYNSVDQKYHSEYKRACYSIPYILYSKLESSKIAKDDIDEHVRLFYVALTRAQNKIIFVGDKSNKQAKETLYNMLDYTYNYFEFDEKEIRRLKLESEVKEYKETVREYYENFKNKDIEFKLDSKKSLELKEGLYLKLDEKYNKKIDKVLINLRRELFCRYLNELKECDDIDSLAKFYGYSVLKAGYISSLQELNDRIINKIKPLDEEEDEEDEEDSDSFYDKTNDEEIEDKIEEDDDINIDNKNNVTYDDLRQYKKDIIQKYDELSKDTRKKDQLNKLIFKNLNGLSYAFSNTERLFYKSYKTDDYEDKTTIFNIFNVEKREKTKKEVKITNKVDDSIIVFNKRTHKRASKEFKDEDVDMSILDRGTYLHQLLEITNLKSKDTSFIKNVEDKRIIDNVLKMDLFENLQDAKIYKEYTYYDDKLDTTGSIDLLIVKDDTNYIVDYKTSNYDDPSYIDQLHTYRDNVEKIFKIDRAKIKMYLLSIIRCQIKEIV